MNSSEDKMSRAFDRGVVVLSIDTEQIWGHLDILDERGFLARFPYSLGVHDLLLDTLCAADICATWTVVGGLSLPGTEGPCDRWFAGLPETWISKIPAGDEGSSPLWYRRSFVKRLRDAHPAQDVGMHGGLTHLIWGDPKTTPGLAYRELLRGISALNEIGIRPRSLAFPRNEVAHLDVLARHGIRCFRGRAPVLSEKLGVKLAQRVARGIEEVGQLTPPIGWPEEVLPGLWNIPASLNLYSMREAASRIAPLRTRRERIRLGIEAAAHQRGIFHLWFHPENLAEGSLSFPVFEEVVELLVQRRDAGEIEILTMNEVVDRMSHCQDLGLLPSKGMPIPRSRVVQPMVHMRSSKA